MSFVDGDRIKVAQEINLPGSVIAVNVYYFEADFIADQTDPAVVNALEAWIEALYGQLGTPLSSEVSLGEMRVYRATGVPVVWDLRGTGTPSVSFVNAADMLPHGVSFLSRAYTERSLTIGRKYVPGFTEEDQTDGDWTVPGLADMANFNVKWGTQHEISVNNTLNPSIYSTVTGFVYNLTNEFVLLAQPAYQRRRRPGVGT